ncbi:diacylglycerol kinase family protein [Mucilaginibacter sp. UR6-1]|uniref:diacylglycerol kinase family protein n=1 Tax=Mucilaginibacter sp. UR6-1 TaxID=1435643 RepID=UPI001E401400|nr:diacylglycerol kinase family protein [Mucilaginibacter sp. UR6-1]MCC8410676.1 diacylglycerol kinase family protein [Mucilaginibacter sp. UR6-1]
MKKVIRSFGYAFKGIGYAYTTQLNFRIHSGATLIAVISGLLLNIAATEWLWIMLAIALVIITEMLNTALELLTDLASPEYNAKAGHVKDISAGCVVIAAVFAVITGGIIFLPKLFF